MIGDDGKYSDVGGYPAPKSHDDGYSADRSDYGGNQANFADTGDFVPPGQSTK